MTKMWRQSSTVGLNFSLFALGHLALAMDMNSMPSQISLKAGVIPAETFDGFQSDLLERIKLFALEDNITLTVETTEIQELYSSNLPLIAPECKDGESVVIEGIEYECSDFDMIIGDYWPNPRYE